MAELLLTDDLRLARRVGGAAGVWRWGGRRRIGMMHDLGLRYLDRALARLEPSHLLDRSRNAFERVAEVGDVDQGQHQAGDPEDVHVREQRDEAEHGDDLELN